MGGISLSPDQAHLPLHIINKILRYREPHPLHTIMRDAHYYYILDWDSPAPSFYEWWCAI